MINESLEQLKNLIVKSDSVDVFGNNAVDLSEIEEACKTFLFSRGFKIISPPGKNTLVKTIDDLISFFYFCAERFDPKYITLYRSQIKDRTIAKRFVNNRIKATNKDFDNALQECVLIINTVFLNFEKFHFDRDISFGIFGQDKFGWVTERAISIINNQYKMYQEDLAEEKRSKMIEIAKRDSIKLDDSDLDAILEKFNELKE